MEILVSIGLAVIGFSTGTFELLKLRRFLKKGIKVKGRRISYATIMDSDNVKIEVPNLEFVDKNGAIIKTKLDTNLHNRKNEIDLIYDPKNPKKIIENYWTKHISWIFLMTFGVISLIFLTTVLASR